MQFTPGDILFLLVLFLAFFIAVFLFTSNKGRQVSNLLLGTFFLSLALNLADGFLLLKQVYFNFPALALWGSNLLLLCGPLIYFYTQSVLYKNFAFARKKLLHFLPFVVLTLTSETAYLAAGHQKQIAILNNILVRNMPAAAYLVSLCIYIHFFTYLLGASKLVRQYSRAAADRYADAQKVTLQWLKTIIYFFLALMLVTLAGSYLSYMSSTTAYFFVLGLTVFLLLMFIVFMLFKALRNPEIFALLEEKEVKAAAQQVKYASSALPVSEKTLILATLQQYMQTNQPYLEAELTLDKLAGLVGVKPKALSQVINELLQQNFFEFVNFYRIEEAKRLLTNPADKKVTVIEIMYQAGFNSKSSFNTLFKKATGLTPGDFKRQNMG